MKHIKTLGSYAVKGLILAAFAFCFLLLFMDAPAAEPMALQPPPSVSAAITAAEGKAAAAVMSGKLADAKAWAEVAMQLRAGQYLAPFGDIAGDFAGQIKNIRSFIGAASDVEAMKPVDSWYNNRFSTAAMNAVFIKNDPAALKLALSQEATWSAMRQAFQFSEHEKKIPLAAADYQALYVWVSNGCWGELDSNKAREVASLQEVQAAIAPFRPGLAPAIPKVVGTK